MLNLQGIPSRQLKICTARLLAWSAQTTTNSTTHTFQEKSEGKVTCQMSSHMIHSNTASLRKKTVLEK